eukprot:7411672-Pyramimonas_sp.AAC.1
MKILRTSSPKLSASILSTLVRERRSTRFPAVTRLTVYRQRQLPRGGRHRPPRPSAFASACATSRPSRTPRCPRGKRNRRATSRGAP